MSRTPTPDARSSNDAALSLRELRFRYLGGESAAWVVDVPRLDLAAGEQMLLRGGSGTGKSTLLNLVAGLMTPSSGTVRVKGTDIHALRGAARDRFRGRTIGMIFQTFNLLQGFTAAENVMAALMFSDRPRGQHRDLARALLTHLGITTPDREVSRLSVGQQQRVAVARAVACDPALVLADEPTASLDPENAGTAIELIQSICREKNAALLCVSHDPTIAERFERVERLEELRSEAAA
ncbi:MAG: ABC transporter ATP-binding protein [Phycisphaeraceae bacterium]|nr:ABC transporter ATP-binding protein [Phycisphaerales bacterium]QOJ18379.1 MAG: ABC transporter ATP-binding protein [Phycisphaeraceae bacterium]